MPWRWQVQFIPDCPQCGKRKAALPGARYPDSQEMSLFFVWLALRMTTLGASRVNCTRQRQGIGITMQTDTGSGITGHPSW